jgi:hypothetical protein
MLKLTKCGSEINGNESTTFYNVEGTVKLAMDGIWDYSGKDTVTVDTITVNEEEDGYKHISVTHDTTWDIYTDSGFESAISAALGYEVAFTEQGMQDNGVASLEI